LYPTTQMYNNYTNMLRKEKKHQTNDIDQYLKETDVIFALSASPDFDRSTALFSDWVETEKCFRIKELASLKMLSKPNISIEAEVEPLREKLFIGEDSLIKSLETKLSVKIDDAENKKSVLSAYQLYDANPNLEATEKEFDYDADPDQTKKDEISKVDFDDSKCQFKCIHEKYAKIPGRVALNVLGARTKTYIHEFAHAMSSAFHGAIVDEYFDKYEIKEAYVPQNSENEPAFYINRLERNRNLNNDITPVHKIFARYNHVTYFSNLEHPSAEEEWNGYFPALKSPFTTCIMDRTYDKAYRFDDLISQFMYDRLIVKINR
jgi:hypothetical protein